MKHTGLLIASIGLVQGLPYQQVPLSYPTERQSPLDASFDQLAAHALKEFNVPGFSVAVVKGNTTYAKGYGIAEYPDKNATADTLYYAGSTSKSFTAASILKLIEESADSPKPLSLQSKVIDFLPWKLQDEYTTEHATLEDALSHRTGLPRHDMSYGGPNFTHQDMIDSLPYLPVTKEIRQEWQYCNIMFIVLTKIIEKLSNTALGDFFKTNIWEPLGMKNTFMDLDEAKATSNLATGYFWDNTTKEYLAHSYSDPIFISGAGGIISSVSDYALYLRAMLQRDASILSSTSYRELRKGRMVAPPFLSEDVFTGPMTYGLGWFFSVYNGYEVIHHSGGVPGFSTNMLYVPERDFAAVIMANADVGGAPVTLLSTFELLDREIGQKRRPDVSGIWDTVMSARVKIMKELRSVAFPDAPAPEDALPHALPLKSYTGTYFHPGYRNITITLADPPIYVGEPVSSENGKILHADVSDRSWPHVLDFEHVNAEHFLVRYHFTLEGAKNFDTDSEAARAEFEVGSDGRADRFGITYEPLMVGKKIWFDRVAD
jgi:CubicO group peptidase (beta-lactamase class C family)